MKLTPEQARSFRTWLTNRGGVLLDCPICRQRDWSAPEYVSTVRVTSAGGEHDTLDEITVSCGRCGYTLHFNPAAADKTRK
ncbi:MAG: hypothetical protein ACYC6L_09270 [Anaerolineae bacterium]